MTFDPRDVRAVRARDVAAAGPICDDCLGGAFGRVGRGLSNGERGRALRSVIGMADGSEAARECWLCEGAFGRVAEWAVRAAREAEGVEFATYLFGVRLPTRWEEAEKLLIEQFGLVDAESAKHAWNREVGKAFEKLAGRGTVDFQDPDLLFTLDLDRGELRRHTASLFVYGRYRKLSREMPQTHWPCRRCRGRGCALCEGTGKQYGESVEEIVAGPLVQEARAQGASLHGAGREDIDARMLGTGRPFVLEILEPRVRSLDLGRLSTAVNEAGQGKVEVDGLRWTSRSQVAAIKEILAEKTYRATVSLSDDVPPDDLMRAVRDLVCEIAQRTPRRVAHRRADLIRRRRVVEASVTRLGPREAELVFRTEGGLYIKELVSGDNDRTQPSLAGLLGVAAVVVELDVLEIASSDFPDSQLPAMDSRRSLP